MTAAPSAAAGPGAPAAAEAAIVVCGARDRVRAALRAALPKRRARLVYVRGAAELRRAACAELVDAVLVDLGGAGDEGWAAAGLARQFSSVAFIAVAPLRASEGAMLARCASLGIADVVVDGVDDTALRELIAPLRFTARFAAALREAPRALALESPLQRAAWARVVAAGGRVTRTSELAASLRVTREHLSRSFGSAAPLKGVLDLVRLLVAAELARSPGYRVQDVAGVLGFATPSHLARSARRVAGCTAAELAGLTGAELVARFVERAGARPGVGATPPRGHRTAAAEAEAAAEAAPAAGSASWRPT